MRDHHKKIKAVLEGLNKGFLSENGVLFAGGTRIVLALSEYRESLDVDFICPGKEAYRAVRSQITNMSFGDLFEEAPTLYDGRDIRADRDAIRAVLDVEGIPIKIEFIHFEADPVFKNADRKSFPVDALGKDACFSTKLLANADRYADGNKDILDLCAMYENWGAPSQASWEAADRTYNRGVVEKGLSLGLESLLALSARQRQDLFKRMKMEARVGANMIDNVAASWLSKIQAHALQDDPFSP